MYVEFYLSILENVVSITNFIVYVQPEMKVVGQITYCKLSKMR